MFVVGGTRSGKTYLSSTVLSGASDKIISLDDVLISIRDGQYHHGEFELYIKSNLDTNNLGALYQHIEENDQLMSGFAQWIRRLIYENDRCVVIEGNVGDRTRNAIKALLPETVFWEVSRV